MDEKNITVLTAYPIELAQGDETCKYATFLISVLDEYDRMGRMIPKEAGEKYHETLRGFPIVAKLIKDRANRGIDFGAHEMRRYRKRNGQEEVTFDTYPIGSVIDTWIESREVAGYEGLKDCIMARAKLWTCRSPEYFKVLDQLWQAGQISSSWELVVTDKEEQSLGRKILKAFSFIGNAILGTTSVPAVRGAGILEYAEAEEEYVQTTEDLNDALLKDLQEQEEITLNETEVKDVAPVEETVVNEPEATEATAPATEEATAVQPEADDTATVSTESAETAPVDTPEAQSAETADTVVEVVDEPTVNIDELVKQVAELTAALAVAQDENAALKAELESLAPIREQYEQLEREKAEAERLQQVAALTQLALNSGFITEAELADEGGDETIRSLIANLDKSGLENIIVERLVSSRSTPAPQTPVVKEFSTASLGASAPKVRAAITEDAAEHTDKKEALAAKGGAFVRAIINK